ncbi:hypothetical protein [Burkholderia anthina]|uniref:hypothetical protein n=1 Tax=Burkholderia anthina TaxID=179879 RepID=UPI00158C0D20|nr:hypothetical protein [Burkholderia anthina]
MVEKKTRREVAKKTPRWTRSPKVSAKRGGFLERRGESVGVHRDDCMKNRRRERKEV